MSKTITYPSPNCTNLSFFKKTHLINSKKGLFFLLAGWNFIFKLNGFFKTAFWGYQYNVSAANVISILALLHLLLEKPSPHSHHIPYLLIYLDEVILNGWEEEWKTQALLSLGVLHCLFVQTYALKYQLFNSLKCFTLNDFNMKGRASPASRIKERA